MFGYKSHTDSPVKSYLVISDKNVEDKDLRKIIGLIHKWEKDSFHDRENSVLYKNFLGCSY